jgi:hypothetical protein
MKLPIELVTNPGEHETQFKPSSYDPGEQLEQRDAPLMLFENPTGHSLQELEPFTLEYNPAVQKEQDDALTRLKKPGLHLLHLIERSRLYNPGEQLAQVEDEKLLYVPVEHLEQVDDPLRL